LIEDLRRTVLIPLAAALITGILVAVLALSLGTWLSWPPIWAGIAGAGAALMAWLAWSARFANILQHQLAPDLEEAAVVAPGPMGPQTITLRIDQENEGGYVEGAFLDRLPVSDIELARLAERVVAGGSLTTSAMAGPGRSMDRPTWEILRDRFITAGLLRWRGATRAHGCEVTLRGMKVFQRLASPTPSRKTGKDG
jgi:hypothetical protein